MENEGLVLLVAWAGWFALLVGLFAVIVRRGRGATPSGGGHPPGKAVGGPHSTRK
jgi:hypothetical protein